MNPGAKRGPKPPPPPTNILKEISEHPESEHSTAAEDEWRKVQEHPGGVMGYYVEESVNRARSGDTEAARLLLDRIIGAVTERSPRSWDGPLFYEDARYLSEAFEKILAGIDPALALGIKTSDPGRRRSKLTETQREALAAGFELLRRNGFTDSQAMNAMEAELASKRTIQRARAEHSWMDLQRIELIKVMAKSIAPRIGKIIGTKKKR